MTADTLVINVSRDWETACDVQGRFMGHPRAATDVLDCGARCRQVRAMGGDCYDFCPFHPAGWRWLWATPPARASPQHS